MTTRVPHTISVKEGQSRSASDPTAEQTMPTSVDKVKSHSPDHELPRSKRQRASVACLICRRRKIRCDSERPHCTNCRKAGVECHYPETGRRARMLNGDGGQPVLSDESVRRLGRRMSRLESMLGAIAAHQGIHISDSSDTEDGDAREDSAGDIGDDPNGTADPGRFTSDDSTSAAANDLIELTERRDPVVYQMGDLEPHVCYSHGLTLTVLHPRRMRRLCERIGPPELGENAETMLYRVWKRETEVIQDLPRLAHEAPPLDLGMIRYCLNLYRETKMHGLCALLDNHDIDLIVKLCGGSPDLTGINMSSPYAVAFPSMIMMFTRYVASSNSPTFGPYSREFALEQNRLAFLHGIRLVSSFYLSPSTFLLFRLLLCFIFGMAQRAMLPQIRGFISTLMCMAVNIGLHRDEGSRFMNPEERRRRAIAWGLAQDLDMKVAMVLSQVPIMTASDFKIVDLNIGMLEDSRDLSALPCALALDRIYQKVYAHLFSSGARRDSVKHMLHMLMHIDEELQKWRKSLPKDVQDPVALLEETKKNFDASTYTTPGAESEDCCKTISSADFYLKTFVAYYHVIILIHSIPAFTPSCLKELKNEPKYGASSYLHDSINKVSDAAQMILAIAFGSTQSQIEANSVVLATNALAALFLKQIRDPRNPSNQGELALIYHYIQRLKETKPMVSAEICDSVVDVWLVFANVLTHLNQKYSPRSSGRITQDKKPKPVTTNGNGSRAPPGGVDTTSYLTLEPNPPSYNSAPAPVRSLTDEPQAPPSKQRKQVATNPGSLAPVAGTPMPVIGNVPVFTGFPQWNIDSKSQIPQAQLAQGKLMQSQLAQDQLAQGHLGPSQQQQTSGVFSPFSMTSSPDDSSLWDTFNDFGTNAAEEDALKDLDIFQSAGYDRAPDNCIIA